MVGYSSIATIGLRPPPDDVGRQKGCKVRIARYSPGAGRIEEPATGPGALAERIGDYVLIDTGSVQTVLSKLPASSLVIRLLRWGSPDRT